ncbi:unnamed protein product [Blepharisma stoltei]|uniref:Uncharacterized protein n=1 Tax=Blepharisma stoltei TaxID=1481888 RepID=A0AAU9K932_9CILI|nr:unnamed protein product [Blepharisma stoltei]
MYLNQNFDKWIIKGRQEIISRKSLGNHKNADSLQKSPFRHNEKYADNDSIGEMDISSISVGVEYKSKGFGNKTPANLSKLHQEILLRKSEQKLRDLEMKDIFPSDSSKECAETEEVKRNIADEIGHNLPTSPEEEIMPESEEVRFLCCKKFCLVF